VNDFYIGFSPTWSALVAADPNLGSESKLVLLIIGLFMSPIGNQTWPGKEVLAELSNLKVKQVDTALRRAREFGYLQFVKGRDEGGYEPRVPHNPPCMELWTQLPKGKAAPVFKVEGVDLLKEVLDATAAHALLDALNEVRIEQKDIEAGAYLSEPDEEGPDSQEVEDPVPDPAGGAAPQGKRHHKWS